MKNAHLITLMAFLLAVQAGSAFGAYSGGTGEPNNPYQIASKADLIALAAATNDYNKCFILTADIDMGGQIFTTAIIAADTDTSGSGYFEGTAFTGTFDGNSHKITHFTINGDNNSFIGLFGYVDAGGSVKNLGLENCAVSQGSNPDFYLVYAVGGLVGWNSGSISNCYSTGQVIGYSNSGAIGGLVGWSDGSISNCYSTGAVSGDSNSWSVGGLVGENDSNINNCYSTGQVSGSFNSEAIGGLVGENNSNINNCYSTGQVIGSSGSQYVGGLVGANDRSINNCYSTGSASGYSGTQYVGGLVGANGRGISNCYSTGSVSGYSGTQYVGGLVGWNYGGGSVLGSFWDTQTSGWAISAGGTGIPTAEMKTKSTFTNAGWNFVAIWNIVEGQTYPFLKSGGGTPDAPYRIATKEDLLAMAADTSYYGKCFILMSDIDMGGQIFTTAIIAADTDTSGSGYFEGTAFTGTFDGNSHKITHFTINGDNNSFIGLFGYVDAGGSVKNLCLENCSVSGSYYVGGLVGWNSGSIKNCYSMGTISGYIGVGGLVGWNIGSINNCYSTGTVRVSGASDSGAVGGLAGGNDGSINNCYSTDSVIGTFASWYVGGLVGENVLTISNCYSTGTVRVSGASDSGAVGGLAGDNEGSISNCFSTGQVSGGFNSEYPSEGVGGLVGENYCSSINNCYSTGAVSGGYYSGSQYIGGLVGWNYCSSINNCYSTGAVSGGYYSGSQYIGGLVGENDGSSVLGSFWDTQTSGWATSAGGTGKTTAEMKTLSTFTSAGWDFTTIWAIYEGTTYPWLRSPLSTITTTTGSPPNTLSDSLKPIDTNTRPPSGNLKRWDGQSWQAVTSWNDTNIHTDQPTVVIAHGWKTADGDPNFFASDSKISGIAKTLYAQSSSANILAWDWQDQAVSNIGKPLLPVYTDVQQEGLYGAAASAARGYSQGVFLARELQALHISNNNLQLIGHSNGGAVVGKAASVLAQCGGQPVERITTLDTPNLFLKEIPEAVDASNLPSWFPYYIDGKFLKTNVNAMIYIHPETASQVEVYYSGANIVGGVSGRAAFGFGTPLNNSSAGNIFNGQIYPGTQVILPAMSLAIDHLRILGWYADTSSGIAGPGQLVAGINWSILNPQTSNLKDGNYVEQELNSHVFGTTVPPPWMNPSLLLAKVDVDNFTEGRPWFGQHAAIVAVDNNGNYAAQIQSGSDGYLYRDVSVPSNASYLTFDLKVETSDPCDFLTATLGNQIIFYQPIDTADSNFWTVDPIFIGNFAGQTETLLFTLNHVGDGTPSILLDNITFSVTLSVADVDMNGAVNFTDYAIFADNWMDNTCGDPNWCAGTDFDHSGSVDFGDLTILASHWLEGE